MSATSTSFQSHGQTQAHNVLQGLTLSGGNNTLNFANRDRFGPEQEPSPGNVHWRVPRRINNLFTGRAKLVEHIKDTIRSDVAKEKVFVITGLGGLGKSEVSLKIANEMRQEYAPTFSTQFYKLIGLGSGACFGLMLVNRILQRPASLL
jgi:hypothetical protein